MKKIIKYQIAILSVASFIYSCGNKNESAEKKETDIESISVKVASIGNTLNENRISATGLITTENEAKCSFKIGGIIEKVNVTEGQFFRKGELLASLKTTEIDAQLEQANLSYEKAKRDYSRVSNLYKDSVATLEQLQNAKTGLDVALKTLEVVGFNKKYALIYAENDGFVTKKIANDGEVIGGGMPVIAINETTGQNNWVLKLGVSDKEWAALSIGSKASIEVDAFPDKKLTGEVFRKSQAADQTSGSFMVEILIDAMPEKLAVGMFGKANIDISNQTKVSVIPYDAVIEADGNKAFVFVPINSTTVKRIPIVIESFTNNQVFVKSGLENVKEVVVSNSAFLNEKSTITIIK